MSIAKNTAYITFAFIFQKILAFVYIALIARNLGPEIIGKYFFALSFTTIFSVFIDAGLTPILIREVAKYKEKARSYFNSIITLKLIFSVLTMIAIAIVINLLGYDNFTKKLVYIASAVMFFDSFTLTFYGVLRSWQILKYEAIGIICYQILTVTLGGIILFTTKSIALLIGVLVISSFLNAIYSFSLAIRIAKIRIKFSIDKQFAKTLLIASFPFMLAGIFNRVYTHIDTVLLSKLAGDIYVGWYGVANKLVFSLQFIPAAFVASIYPAMSNYFEHSKEKLKTTFEKSIIYLTIISIPICFGVVALAKEIITTIYGNEFLNSILPLQLLMVALVFVFLYFPIGSLLNASNRQKRNTANMGIAMVVNVILNLILIPKINLAGAAIASVISQFLMLCLGMYYARQVVPYDKRLLSTKFIQNIITAFIMALGIIFLKQYINWIFIIPLSAIFYFGFLYLIKGFSKNDVKEILISIGIKKYRH
ncbi:MAG: oligosaccharide flippase family protein [Xanthomonadaceae bacterium]|nr:oligosaccharide flippase family protein [Rhodospirillaceae bacterium]NIA17831.1 oligosaccharide flippase family protein [Xanthomonadaceae bacterium]